MAVYVDDMYLYLLGRFGRLKMSHLLADTDAELHAMARRIGVARAHWQSPAKTSGSHYDIAMSKRVLAINAGAIAVTLKQAAAMNARRRATGQLGEPDAAIAWLLAVHETRRGRLESDLPDDSVMEDTMKTNGAASMRAAIVPATRSPQVSLSLFPPDDEYAAP